MSKAPKLRFKEFSGDWKEKKLGDLLIKSTETTNENSDIPVLTSSRKGLFLQSEYFKKEIAAKDTTGYNILRRGYFTYRHMSDDSTFFFNINNILDLALVSPEYPVFTTNDSLNSYILQQHLNNSPLFYNFCKKQKKGGTRTRLYFSVLQEYKLAIPSKEEQDKMASFFSLIDNKISLQGEKVEALKDYKRGMMQKIFSRELRFKDDEGRDYPEWEEKKLGDCIENKGGTALEKFVDENGTHKFISIGNYSTSGKYIDSGQRISLNDKTKDKLLYKNDLVMVLNDKTATGDLIGSTILIDEDNTYIYNQRSERLICNENINPDFAWILLNYEDFRKRVFSIAQGGTQIYVNFPSVKNLNIQLPSLKEQNKISELILALDNKIEKEQEKLDSLNEYKKGLLQQMFV